RPAIDKVAGHPQTGVGGKLREQAQQAVEAALQVADGPDFGVVAGGGRGHCGIIPGIRARWHRAPFHTPIARLGNRGYLGNDHSWARANTPGRSGRCTRIAGSPHEYVDSSARSTKNGCSASTTRPTACSSSPPPAT